MKMKIMSTNNANCVVLADEVHSLLQSIKTEVEAKRDTPQELWLSLREFIIASATSVPPGLLHDVIEFCLAVFDSLEPNATVEERDRRIASVNTWAIVLNLRMGEVVKGLPNKDNSFLWKWDVALVTNMIVLRHQTNNPVLNLSAFELLAAELQQVDHEDRVLSVWLYSLYTALFKSAHGVIPAGMLGVASFGIGLAIAGEMINNI